MSLTTSEQGLLDTISKAPLDPLPKLAYADLLAERQEDRQAFAYRWMAAHGKYPARRKRAALDRRWAWYSERSRYSRDQNLKGHHGDIKRNPQACLDDLVFMAGRPSNLFMLFAKEDQAIWWLAQSLARMQSKLSLEKSP